jgi:hypothetical protein
LGGNEWGGNECDGGRWWGSLDPFYRGWERGHREAVDGEGGNNRVVMVIMIIRALIGLFSADRRCVVVARCRWTKEAADRVGPPISRSEAMVGFRWGTFQRRRRQRSVAWVVDMLTSPRWGLW